MRKIVFLVLCGCLLGLCGCNNKTVNKAPLGECDSVLHLKYAEGFAVRYHKGYKEVIVNDPWKQGEIMVKYYLVSDAKTEVPTDGTKLTTPLRSISTTSCTHIEFINRIGLLETVKGVCTPDLIYNKDITERYQIGDISNLGDAFNINLERVIVLATDGIMVTSYNQQDESIRRLEKSGIPVIFNNEWTESSLLARAEWLKFVAAFYDKEQEATRIFEEIATSYRKYTTIADSIPYKPTILAGGNFKGTWYIPGGRSYMGRLFADAGSDYLYKNDTTKQSIPLNFESVLLNLKHADVWLNAPTSDMKSLYVMDDKHRLFSAAQNGKVFAFTKRINAKGANDFWESAVTHPDLVLKDVIWALHPSLMGGYEPTYIINLK